MSENKDKDLYLNFDEYIRQGEPQQKERAEAWSVAIGLQAVDGLKTSEYLQQTARRNIEGENCQMLGEVCGNNPDEAKDNLMKENPWIAEAGFSRSEFIVRQLTL